jgi:transcriptional regulator with XRE-family HTH domain
MKKETLGQLITRRLRDLEIIEAEVARRIHKTPQYVGDLISGKKDNPSKSVIKELATAIQVSPLEILVALDYLPQEVLGDKKEQGFLQQLRELPGDQKNEVEIIMAAFHKEYVIKPSRGRVEDSLEPPRRSRKAKVKS